MLMESLFSCLAPLWLTFFQYALHMWRKERILLLLLLLLLLINVFVLKGELNGENRSGAFLFLSGICLMGMLELLCITIMLLSALWSVIISNSRYSSCEMKKYGS